ncbi:MAG TPA: family 16 glycoside hydrolase [Aridibacter sp.]|nr:family 16 glycoside hydrolase [Aridibacter sp.]
MKICPKCGKTYDDETLNFCLEDGSVLNRYEQGAASEPPPTVMMPGVAPTSVQPPAPVTAPQVQQAYGSQYTMQPKKSRAWIWALVALFGVIVLCGGGFVGLVVIGSLDDDEDQPPSMEESLTSESPPDKAADRKVVNRESMSTWPASLSKFDGLEAEFKGGELLINTKKGYYYVISTGGEFKTADSTVSVKVRNPSGRSTNYGYGIVVHSDPAQVLKRDYAFLIKADDGTYRIAEHVNQQESNIVAWKSSGKIKKGTKENHLEIRCEGDKMSFYINGEFIRTVTDYSDFEGGVAGIYTSDDVPIAFSDLELKR